MAKSDKTVKRGVYLYIDGKEIKNDINSIDLEVKRLQRDIKDMTLGSEEYNRTMQKIRGLKGIIKEHREEMHKVGDETRKSTLSLSQLADGFNRYAGVAAGAVATLTGMTLTMRKCVDDYAKMEEAMSQVSKYTGMTREEVELLNEEFKKMDTRTSREELNRLAGEAGKLGITGVQDVLEFVEAANMINVALGEDLGEEAVNQIGKLSQMFGDSGRSLKENMLAIGSAINQVAQSTSASEPYLVEFTARMGGVGKQAGMAVTDIMGFASALDQNMLRSEMASTALSGLVMRIYQEPARYAELAKMDVQEFTQLVETDVNEAVLRFLESLNKMGGMANLAPVLKDMKLSGSEAASVVSTLAGNVGLVRKEQENANLAFREGISITNEYSVQNNTVQAELDKARKAFQDVRVELGEKLQPVMKHMISAGSMTVKGLNALINVFSRYGTTITMVTALILAHVAAQKTQVAWSKMVDLWNGKLVTSFQRLWMVLRANPWAAILAVGATFIAFMRDMGRSVDDAVRHQRMLNQVMREASSTVKTERNQLDALLKTARDKALTDNERQKAIDELNRISPEYLGNLNLENINTGKADEAIKKYTASILANAKAKAINAKLEDLERQKQDLRDNPGQLSKWYDPFTAGLASIASDAERVKNTIGSLFTRGNLSGWTEQTGMEQNYATNSLEAWGNRYTAKMRQIIEDEKLLKAELEKVVRETVSIAPDDDDDDDDDDGTGNGNEKELATAESAYYERIAAIKKRYLEDDSMTQADYSKQMQDAELALLNEKLRIAGLEPEQRQQIADRILDIQIKLKEELRKADEEAAKETERMQKKESEAAFTRLEKSYQLRVEEVTLHHYQDKTSEQEYYDELRRIQDEYYQSVLEDATVNEEKKNKIREQMRKRDLENTRQMEEESIKREERLFGVLTDLGTDIGQATADFLTNSETSLKDYLKNVTNALLDGLQRVMIMAIAERTIKNLASLGPWGLLKAAGEIALITAAFETAKALVSNFYTGGYTPSGAWDQPQGIVHSNEFVANRYAVANPHLRPLFDAIDVAQRSGNVGNLTMDDVLSVTRGSSSSSRTGTVPAQVSPAGYATDPALLAVLAECTRIMHRLKKRFDEPIVAETYVTGKRGINQAQKEYRNLENNKSRNKS